MKMTKKGQKNTTTVERNVKEAEEASKDAACNDDAP